MRSCKYSGVAFNSAAVGIQVGLRQYYGVVATLTPTSRREWWRRFGPVKWPSQCGVRLPINAIDSVTAMGDGGFVGRASGAPVSDCGTGAGLADCAVLGRAGPFAEGTYRERFEGKANQRIARSGAGILLGVYLVSG